MSLHDALRAALPELRAEALARMTSTATIRRATGRTVQDETTGREVPVWDDVAVGVPFRLGGPSSGAGGTRTVTVGGIEYQQATGVGHLPHDLTDLRDNDHVDVTAGEWAGTALRIVEASKKDQATARRVPVVEVPRPAEWV